MKRKSDPTIERTFLISRRIVWSYLALFLLGVLIGPFTESYDLNWLKVIVQFIGVTSVILLAISWIMPGILILLRVPWLARAWFRGGINPIVSDTPWEELSSIQKFLTYIWSTAISGFTLLAIMGLIIQSFRK